VKRASIMSASTLYHLLSGRFACALTV